ncbi:MAG: BREX-1 system adenine-specific DNA-methyltransferase PglX, partial [Candidatus Saccharimonadales bacterium]
EYGSILKVKPGDYAKLREQLNSFAPMDRLFYASRTEQLIHQTEILSRKYTIAVTNPPYMPASKFDSKLKTYVGMYYADSKSDLYSVFMEVCLSMAQAMGYVSMINMQSWMFLSGQEKLRNLIQSMGSMVNMIHLGPGAFPEMVGDVLQTTTFTIRVGATDITGDYIRVTDVRDSNKKEALSLAAIADEKHELRYRASNADFEVFPGKIIAYWASNAMKRAFINGKSLDPNYAHTNTGIMTGDNGRFVRLWWEVPEPKLKTDAENADAAQVSGKKWFPYNKGGEFRRWYGNNDYIVNWQDDGREIFSRREGEKRFSQNIPRQYRFTPALTWSKISSGNISFRYKPSGHLFDIAGASMFADNETLTYLQGMLNSSIIGKFASVMSPTLNFESGQIGSYPIIESVEYRDEVIDVVNENRLISKSEWDSFETSWDFERHPLLPVSNESKLADAFETWDNLSETRWNKLKTNEERLNEIFIEVYGMQDELNPTVEDKYVSVRKADMTREAKSLLSYFVGVMFGRYSLDKPGLNFAGGEWNAANQSTLVDADNIVPIMDGEFYTDDIVKKLRDFLV